MARAATAEVDDWITPSADGPDDWITPEAVPSKSSTAGAFVRGAERGALPAAAGFGGFVAGASAVQPLVAPLAAMTGPAAPIVEGVGTFLGGAAGAYGGATVVEHAQRWVLDHAPEGVVKALGMDKEQEAADAEEHPYASMAGELAPNLALVRPGAVKTLVDEGAPAIEKLMANPLAARAVPAAIMGTQEAATEQMTNGEVDPTKVAIAAGVGAVSNRETALGQKLGRASAAPVEAVTTAIRNRIHPGQTPDEIAAPILDAGSVDEAITAANGAVDREPLNIGAMAETARQQGEAARARDEAAAAPLPAEQASPGPDWETLYDEAGAEIGWYHAKSEEMRLKGAEQAGAEQPPTASEKITSEPSVSGENPAQAGPEEITPVSQPSAKEFPPFADAKLKADTYNRWLGELDAQRRQEAAKSPQARFLQQTADAILNKVNGVEDRLTQRSAERLQQTRQALDDLLNPVGDSPDMARVRASMVGEHQNMADAVVAHRDQAMARAQEAREHAKALQENLSDEEADQIASAMAEHKIDAGTAVSEHIERKALQEVQSDHGQTGDQAYAEAVPFRGGEGAVDSGAGEGLEGRAPAGISESREGAPGNPASAIPGQARELIPPGTEAPMLQRRGSGEVFDWDVPGGGSRVTKVGPTEVTYGIGKDKTAELSLVRTSKTARNSGAARAAIEQFLKEADARGVTVHLTAEPMDSSTSKARLERFYKSLGFKENRGRTRDFSTRAAMIREPQGPQFSRVEAAPAAPVNVRVLGTFTPEFDTMRAKVGTDLQQRLDKLGLKEIALKLPDSITSMHGDEAQPVHGAYAKKIIAVALDGPDHVGTFDHEAVHAVKSLGLFSKSEWSILSNRASRDWRTKFDIDKRYGDLPEEKRNEEAIAEAYRVWSADRGTQKGMLARIFDRVRNTLAAIGSVLRGHGFTTAESVFSKLEAGEIGARERSAQTSSDPKFQVREKDEAGAIPMRAVLNRATGKVEFRPVPQAPKPAAPPPSAEPAPVRDKPLKAIEGTGNERERAINGELYNVGEEAPQLEAAAKLAESNPERAVAIAMRQKAPPAGVHPELVYIAVEAKAVRDGDFDLQYKLRKSKIAEEATTMGQRIAAWRNRAEISPVDDMRRVDTAREAKLKERGIDVPKAVETLVTAAKAEIKRAAKTQSLNDFVLANLCPA